MAEFETNEVDTDVDYETEVDTQEDDTETPTVDDYLKLKDRLAKAEKRLVEEKKKAKATVEKETGNFLSKEDYKLERFLDKNPGYEWKEEEIKKYMKKWLELDEIKKLVEPDSSYANKEKTKQASITAWESGWGQTSYTKQELADMSQEKYNQVMDLKAQWKVVIRG